ERDGQEFVANARQSGFVQDRMGEILQHFYRDYKGPIGKPSHDWRIEPEAGVRLREFAAPQKVGPAWGLSKSFVLPFRLTLDRRTGKVTKSEALTDRDADAYAVRGASLSWVVDPSTIPEDAVVNVKVYFHANCDGQK